MKLSFDKTYDKRGIVNLGKKKIVVIIIAAVICIIGVNIINKSDSGIGGGFSSGLEKSLISTLPEEITTCYYRDTDGNDNLNVLEIKNFTIDRQTTDGNFKSADCTIEMEGTDLKKTVYVNLSCIKYDDGSWQVEGYQELSEPIVIPKRQPSEWEFISYIEKETGFKQLIKEDESIDLQNRKIMYTYNALDGNEYITFTGDGVSCIAELECYDYYGSDYDTVYYKWDFYVENKMKIIWNVLGNWHLEAPYSSKSGSPNYILDMTVEKLEWNSKSGNCKYYCPTFSGDVFTGKYDVKYYYGTSVKANGNSPLGAECRISTGYGEITINIDGVTGWILDSSYLQNNATNITKN